MSDTNKPRKKQSAPIGYNHVSYLDTTVMCLSYEMHSTLLKMVVQAPANIGAHDMLRPKDKMILEYL